MIRRDLIRLQQATKDVSTLRFYGFETFGNVLEEASARLTLDPSPGRPTWFNEEDMKKEKIDTWDGMLGR